MSTSFRSPYVLLSPFFLTIILLEVLSGAEMDVFVPSFVSLQDYFYLDPFAVQFTVSVNFIAYCIGALLAGTLGDKYGRRKVILGGLLVFVIGSMLCTFAPDFPTLLVGRFIQGLGISGPSVLAFVLISDKYPSEQQPYLMGLLNGFCNLAVAAAPSLGSFLNTYYDWRSTFWLLLIVGCINFISALLFIHDPKPIAVTKEISFTSYTTLLKSKPILTYNAAMVFLCIPYWIFIGIAPIYYVEILQVPLIDYGLYQGAVAGSFALVSILSPLISRFLSEKQCFYFSCFGLIFAFFALSGYCLFSVHNAVLLSTIMVLYAISLVFPVNILFPRSLEVHPEAKGKVSSLWQCSRLILSSVFLGLVSFFYSGEFHAVGFGILLSLALGALSLRSLFVSRTLKLI